MTLSGDYYTGCQGQWGGYFDSDLSGDGKATGPVWLGRRFYDPARGRFLTRDPSGYGGGANLYAYCGDDPVNLCDPTGLNPQSDGGDDYNGLWYDRLARWSDNAFGPLNGLPGVDDVNGLLHLPHAVGHLGQGTGNFAADPSLANAPGLVRDVVTFGSVVAAGAGAAGAGGAGASSRAITASDLGVDENVFSRSRRKISISRGTMTARIENVVVADDMKGQANVLGWAESLESVARQEGVDSLKFEGTGWEPTVSKHSCEKIWRT